MDAPGLAALLTRLRLGLRHAAQSRTAVPREAGRLLAALAEALERRDTALDPVVEEAALAALELLAQEDLELLAGDGFDVDALGRVGRSVALALRDLPAGPEHPLRRAAWAWLDVARRPPVPRLVAGSDRIESWWPTVLEVIDSSEFTFGRLFAQRVESLGPRTLFRVPARGEAGRLTWHEVSSTVDRVARGLLALLDEAPPGPVAIVSENRYEMAVVDLACLTSGIVNVMIPPGSTEEDVDYVLTESGATVAVVSTEAQLAKVARARGAEGRVAAVVMLDSPPADLPGVVSFPELVARGRLVTMGRLTRARDAVQLSDLATVMYTSGTTGTAEGDPLLAPQHRLQAVRARAGAAGDRRGRRLPLLPAAVPHLRPLLRDVRLRSSGGRPTSSWRAPRSTRWSGDSAASSRRSSSASRRSGSSCTSEIAPQDRPGDGAGRGGAGRDARRRRRAPASWGCRRRATSTPAIFRFFQSQGVELMSGFGMTEATGGITMTPPGQYRDDSLGLPLPGIEAARREDGELPDPRPVRDDRLRRAPEGSGPRRGRLVPHRATSWSATRTATSASSTARRRSTRTSRARRSRPQRIENLFREFESVRPRLPRRRPPRVQHRADLSRTRTATEVDLRRADRRRSASPLPLARLLGQPLPRDPTSGSSTSRCSTATSRRRRAS